MLTNSQNMTALLSLLVSLAALEPAAASPRRTSDNACTKLSKLDLPNVEILSTTFIDAKDYPSSAPTISGAKTVTLAPHCEVKAIARPTRDSEIGIEIWLPATGWNGRYQQIGNGGWAGAIHRRPLADALKRGFAAASTDNGHQGGVDDHGQGQRSAEFAIGHPEKLIDFGSRALSETRRVATAAITSFYGRPAQHSYFVGCSDGGREALMAAQRFPEYFDGILAGNPGNAWSRWAAGLIWTQQAQRAGSPGAIPITKRALIQNAVMSACDQIDGVTDGLIADPRFCRFDPAVLTCSGTATDNCLTDPQVATLRQIYDGPRNPRTGEQIYPGYPPGIENAPGSNLITPWQPGMSSFGDTYFGQALFERRDWDFRSLDFDKDIALSDRKGAPVVDATNPDLRSFRARGGKLIHYHGWSDALMPAGASIAYYEAVMAFMARFPDQQSVANDPITSFYRLFLIPGMGHCYGGDGPTAITVDADTTDPKRDLITALEQWVEKGVAPQMFVGSGPVPNAPSRRLSRPICPYPQITRYDGSGNTDIASSFACAKGTGDR
ncbi:tannase/feruloyl esterase family alpha/beta hydrolase [Sphingomonas crocodyli]|uniref:Tannase/feruloyl esterase family alpha/beta hydrolase n=1 Tax=Sphingomonas crocodyli TaxID=1979270 RepID=A0A437M760_9SPHN|nr:tannase/feruloyl esterase family alpha/beta hydrolase [Sphingomonas crocodyli]RVT93561.1 tannase/feruloyl esterase family alpha/beta hydrolase [Sphingomonas crocodyli]